MHPILYELRWADQQYAISAYRTLMLVAAVTTLLVGVWLQRRGNIAFWPGVITLLSTMVGLYAGARGSYWWLQTVAGSAAPVAGLWLPGGMLVAMAMLVLVGRAFRLPVGLLLDRMIPALGLGGAILRCGCYLQGCCHGRPTSLPWGVVFPWGSPAQLTQALDDVGVLFRGMAPVHPTQIYELAACLFAAGIGAWGLRARLPTGLTALAAFAWFSLFRFGNAWLRAPDPRLPTLQFVNLAISLAAGATCLAGMWWLWRVRKESRHSGHRDIR